MRVAASEDVTSARSYISESASRELPMASERSWVMAMSGTACQSSARYGIRRSRHAVNTVVQSSEISEGAE